MKQCKPPICALSLAIVILYAICPAPCTLAAVRFVDLESPAPTPPYTSWLTTATNIQDAVNASVAGDVVLVTNGLYQFGGPLTILGTTKELIEYHLLDDSLFVRPPIRIAQPERLLSLPDADFQQYDAEQRSNLVVRATAKAPDPSEVFGELRSMRCPRRQGLAPGKQAVSACLAETYSAKSVKLWSEPFM